MFSELGVTAAAEEEYRKPAAPAAQFNLGWMYDEGEGVPKDAAEAVKWQKEGAKGRQATYSRMHEIPRWPSGDGDCRLFNRLWITLNCSR